MKPIYCTYYRHLRQCIVRIAPSLNHVYEKGCSHAFDEHQAGLTEFNYTVWEQFEESLYDRTLYNIMILPKIQD